MRESLPAEFQDEAVRRLATDINQLMRELVEEGEPQTLFRDLKMKFVKVKLGHVKLRLAKLKQSLQHHLELLEDRLRDDERDEDVRYYVALVTEHLADMWLMEALLERVTKCSERTHRGAELSFGRPSARSSELEAAGEAVQLHEAV